MRKMVEKVSRMLLLQKRLFKSAEQASKIEKLPIYDWDFINVEDSIFSNRKDRLSFD